MAAARPAPERRLAPASPRIPSAGEEKGSRPLVPWGTTPPPPGDAPRGVIGVALHKAMNLSGPPGRAAAQAEASVLGAIAADPALAFWDPPSIRAAGARVTRKEAEEIAAHVAREAERVIEDVRRRAEAGDRTAMRWIDPDSWSFQHEGEAPGPRP